MTDPDAPPAASSQATSAPRGIKVLASRLVTAEQAERLSKLSPQERKEVISVASKVIATLIRNRATQKVAGESNSAEREKSPRDPDQT